ncbi:MAG: hypothetical protein PHE61_03845 [Candidatus Omnitrophica bacterium]|nr:hypothetical protein [Candidatus Omnitrophota bacterium]
MVFLIALSAAFSQVYAADIPEESNESEVTSEAAKRQLEIEAEFQENKELREESIKYFLNEGKRLAEKGEYDLAVEVIEQVFVLDPLNEEASREIDLIKERYIKDAMESYERAEKVLSKEIEEETTVYLESAKTLIQNRHWADAKVLLRKVLALDPNQKEAKKLLNTCEKSGAQKKTK